MPLHTFDPATKSAVLCLQGHQRGRILLATGIDGAATSGQAAFQFDFAVDELVKAHGARLGAATLDMICRTAAPFFASESAVIVDIGLILRHRDPRKMVTRELLSRGRQGHAAVDLVAIIDI